MRKCHFIFLFLILAAHSFCPLMAADDKTKNSTTQQVGGLLFDVDEGVKIEHGPGGSVYLKSNREFMQEKFKSVDEKIADLEKRVTTLETAAVKPDNKKKSSVSVADPKASPVPESTEVPVPEASAVSETGKRVLVT